MELNSVILFFILPSFLTLVTSNQVPDGAVWTSPTETFWLGQRDVALNCLFQRTPIAVYWLKGETLQSSKLIIMWYEGETTKYNSEAFDFDEHFSLLFRHPNTSDTGRYFCALSNYQGILKHNHTDLRVLDPKQNIAYTIPRIIGWKGESVHLPCDFLGTASLISWTKEFSDRWGESIQIVAEFEGDVSCKVEGNQYACSRNYGLTIRDLAVSEEANFTCTVIKEDGTLLKNTTSLFVYAKADDSYPRVEQCEGDSSNLHSTCVVQVSADHDILQLDCVIEGTRPPVLLSWVHAESTRSLINTTLHDVKEREDGTYRQVLTLRVDKGELKSDPESLICMAQGPAVSGTANQTVKIDAQPKKGPVAGIIGGLICVLIVVTAAVVFIVRRKNINAALRRATDKERGHEEMRELEEPLDPKRKTMEEKREEVKKYKPQISSTKGNELRAVHLGVFGLLRAGKSAFINSLYFAISGEYRRIADESKEDNQRTVWRETKKLAPAIKITDNRGIEKYDKRQLHEYMQQIDGKRGKDPKRKVKDGQRVDCPILICNFSEESGEGESEKKNMKFSGISSRRDDTLTFIAVFSQQVHQKYGRRLVIVLTHENALEKENRLGEITDWLVEKCAIPRDHIWAFENYTHYDNCEDVDKNIKLLTFLLKCTQLAEENIEFKRISDSPQDNCLIS